MPYVDGYIVSVPEKNLPAYRRMARKAGKVWIEHGALQYHESVGDDMDPGFGVPFPTVVKPKRGEVVVFAWVMYKTRAHRDRVNAKAMKDERMTEFADPKNLPFDCKRMIWGGFKSIVDL